MDTCNAKMLCQRAGTSTGSSTGSTGSRTLQATAAVAAAAAALTFTTPLSAEAAAAPAEESSPAPMTNKTKDLYAPESETARMLIPIIACATPFSLMCFFHGLGYSHKFFMALYRLGGARLLIGITPLTISFEKCIYDTTNCFCGRDPNTHTGNYPTHYPSGGHMLPSFSLVQLRKIRPPAASAASAAPKAPAVQTE
jgi:hypothetical protein